MSFSIDIQPISTFKRIRIANHESKASIDIMSKGGVLNSWLQTNDQWDIIDGNNFESGWGNYESNGFKSGKMSPYACRLSQGQFTHLSQSYKIEKFYLGAHALHGILYDVEYDIVETKIKENSAYVILQHHYQGTDKGFPFAYTIRLHWIFFTNNKISIETTITNQSETSIPMMDGWHPYFKLGKTINDCTLQFINKGILVYNNELIPTGEMLTNTMFDKGSGIADTQLDSGYIIDAAFPKCILENEKYILTIEPSPSYPYLQLYTPDHRGSIAIENLSGAPDCFNNKMGLHVLQPQEVWKLETSYQLTSK